MERSRLKPDLELSRQSSPKGNRVVVRDPSNGSIYSFPESAFALLSMADGTLNADALADRFFGRVATPQERERVDKIFDKAESMGLFESGDSQSTAVNQAAAHRRGLLWRLLVFSLPLWLMDGARKLGSLFSAPGYVFVFVLWVAVLWWLASRVTDYWGMLQVFFHFSFWPQTIVLLLLSVVWHELGHLAAATRGGARAGRFGVGVYLFIPTAYVRIDDFFMISTRAARVKATLGGVYFDMIFVAICILVWGGTENYTMVNQIVLVTSYLILIRVAFNLLPVLRLDGYWAITELIGVRHLREEGFSALLSVVPVLRKRFGGGSLKGLSKGLAATYALLVVVIFVGITYSIYQYLQGFLVAWWPRYSFELRVALAVVMGVMLLRSFARDGQRALRLGIGKPA